MSKTVFDQIDEYIVKCNILLDGKNQDLRISYLKIFNKIFLTEVCNHYFFKLWRSLINNKEAQISTKEYTYIIGHGFCQNWENRG